MIRKSVLLTATLAVLTVPSFCGAQSQKPVVDSSIGATRNVQSDRAAIISEAMDFSTRDAAAFWPIYEQYERERPALYDRRIAVLKEYEEKVLVHERRRRKSDGEADVRLRLPGNGTTSRSSIMCFPHIRSQSSFNWNIAST